MYRRFFITLLVAFFAVTVSNTYLYAGKKKHIVPPDIRTLVTAVNQQTKTITLTSMTNKSMQTYQFANPAFYRTEVIINGQEKSISDITVGMQFYTCDEIAAGVIRSITLATAAPAPK